MPLNINSAESRALVAKLIRDFADKIESGAVRIWDSSEEVETKSREDWSTGATITEPTNFRRVSIRYEHVPPVPRVTNLDTLDSQWVSKL